MKAQRHTANAGQALLVQSRRPGMLPGSKTRDAASAAAPGTFSAACPPLWGALAVGGTPRLQHAEVGPECQLREGPPCFRDGLCNGSAFTAATLKPFREQKQRSLFQERPSSANSRAALPLPGPADAIATSLPRGVKSTSPAFLGIARVPGDRPGEMKSHRSWPGTWGGMRASLNTLFCVGLCGLDSFS